MATTRNFSPQWKQVFITEEVVSVATLKPGNFYKITTYQYADGVTKSLSGPDLSYIFLLGKYTNNGKAYLAAIKLKNVDPAKFFDLIKPALKDKPTATSKIEETYSNTKSSRNNEFSTLLKTVKPDGKNLFGILKNNSDIMGGYREYIVSSVRGVSYVDVNPEYLKVKITKNSKKPEALKAEREFLNNRKAKNAKTIAEAKKSGKQLPNLENKK